MKKNLLTLFFFLFPIFLFAQSTWTQKANFGGAARYGAVGFSIGTKGYIGTGAAHWFGPFYNDFWEWDQTTDTWTQKTNFPSTARASAIGFAIGNKGYIGLGSSNLSALCPCYNDLWEYDPTANTWTQKTSFPSNPRAFAFSFTIGTSAYMGTGYDGSNKNDLWEWNQITNAWTQKTNFGGSARLLTNGFSIGTKGYVGTGWNGSSHYSDFWEWDQTTDAWTQKANFPGPPRAECAAFSIGNNGYMGLGSPQLGVGPSLSDFWKYDPVANSWTSIGNFSGGIRELAASFVIGCKAYVGTGWESDNPASLKNDLWEFYDASNPITCTPPLVQTYDSSTCGLNFVQASQLVETRSVAAGFNTNGTGLPTTLNISGLPSCNTILKAYVWYIVSYIGASAQTSSVDITNPALSTSNSTAAIIGTDIAKCWGETGTAVYRADVTSAISGNGNYGININGITGTNATFPNWYDQIDGVTLFIIYKDYSANYQGSLVIWDGNITSVTGAVAQTMTGINACGNSTSANAFLLVSDMQGSQAPPQHSDILNGSPPTNFNNDFYNFDLMPTAVTAAQATANYGTTPSGGDCFTWGMMGLYYQTTTCITCTPSALSVSVTATPAACGNSNGTATATASGIPPYTYSWNPTGQTTQTAAGLAAGTYTVTVTDSVGCITVDSITVIPSPPLSLSFPVIVNVDCFGNNTGSASVNVSSGTPPYTYSWNPTGQTTQTATGLSAGTFSVTVIDSFGCSITNTVSISEPLPLSNSFSAVTNVSCFGGNNGSATANISGGTLQYTYSWSNGASTSSATGLSAGNYTVTVTDSMGCVLSNTITITSPTPLTHSFSAVANVDCFGNCTGAATANGAGATPSYTYSWNSIPVQTTQTATGLCAGTYSVTVTDANGCSLADTVTIVSPTGLGVFSPAITNVDCFGNNTGSATLTPFGGTPGYTYSWNPTAQTNATATGLIAGVYSITITDNNGCIVNTLVQITEPTQLFALAGQTNILCFGDSTGTATMNVSGATPAYTYFWSPSSQTTSTATNLSAGNYTATITDANGCTITSTFTITQPAAPLSTTSSVVNVLCNPDSTGSASVTVSGGTAGYTYLWNTNATTSSISNLSAGNYSVLITDANGCLDSSTVTVTQPPLLTSTQSQVNILCFGDSTGTATVSPAGGNPAYTYLWSNAQTGSTATNLSAGNYSVAVTDANGCTLTTSFTLTQPVAPLSATSSSVNVLCNPDSTGSASVTVSGGTGTYTYLWMPSGETTQSISNLPAGTYTVTFTDANGCSDTSIATVTQPPLLTTVISNDTTVCAGVSTPLSVTAAGGTPGYTYLWNPIGQTTSAVTVSSSTTTTYSVTVTDANGCSSQQLNTTVTVVPLPVATISVSPSAIVFYPASICFTADTNNTISWNWNFGDSSTSTGTSSVCHDFEMGTFCVTLSVANYLGCIDTAEVCVSEVSATIPNVFSPNGDGSNDLFFIPIASEGLTYYSCKIYDRWGIKMAELDLPREGWDGFTTSGLPASEGTYYYVVSVAWGELKIDERGFITLVR